MKKSERHAPEVRERAVRFVFEKENEHETQWAAIRSIAEKMGCYRSGCMKGGIGMSTLTA